MEAIIAAIAAYQPATTQEVADKKLFMEQIRYQENLLTRENLDYHFSSSAWVVNPEYDKTLMIYHNIYQSYAWAGGHADGMSDLLQVAKKELVEETGIKNYQVVTEKLFSFDILPVPAHYKNGKFIKEHNHINTTYLFVAPETQNLQIKPDENSDVKWIAADKLEQAVAEVAMHPYYRKLMNKAKKFKE